MLKDKFVLGVGSLVAVTIVIGTFLSSSRTIATSTSAQAIVNVAEACTMSSTLTTPHSATIPNGTYQENIGITTLKVTCNDSQGYAIYAVGYTGDEIGGTNSTKLVGASNNIDTGTATSGNTSNWAMKISTSGSSFIGTIDNSFNNYHAVPSEYTKVAHFNSSTDAGPSANGSTYQTTYAAFVSSAQLAGNYTGKVKYTMVHPANEFMPHEVACAAGKICYNPNTAIVEGQMGTQSATNNSSRVLYAPNFKKQGYGFAGWSDAYDYENNPNANIYGPQETITAPSDVQTNGLSLYAVWIKSAGNLQDSSKVASICSNLVQSGTNVTRTTDSVSALTDQRDDNTYAIAKLADGKCWMIENLRLDDSAILSSSNTHNPALPLTNIYDSNTTSNHLSPTSSIAYDATTAPEGWCNDGSSACIDQSRLRTDNTTLFSNNTLSTQTQNIYSYGNYYDWYSATAGKGNYNTTSSNVDGDICPLGWRLPTGGNNGELKILNTAINGGSTNADTGLRVYPANFVYAGLVSGYALSDRSSSGHYWSSTASSPNYKQNSLILYFRSSYTYAGTTDGSKFRGYSVRCIADT